MFVSFLVLIVWPSMQSKFPSLALGQRCPKELTKVCGWFMESLEQDRNDSTFNNGISSTLAFEGGSVLSECEADLAEAYFLVNHWKLPEGHADLDVLLRIFELVSEVQFDSKGDEHGG
ncbi:hypothetical protein AAHE18_01G142100 [Arachis hypogaea]|nr:uncharacterized protein DS421_1g17920 [Arachis hypogaea]